MEQNSFLEESYNSLIFKFPRKQRSQEIINLNTLSDEAVKNILLFDRVYSQYDPSLSVVDNEIRMALYFMKESELFCHERIEELIKSPHDNIFEIYDLNFKQVFRSHSFLKFETYTVAELMSLSNFALYNREPGYVPAIQESLHTCISQEKLVKFNVPTHKVWEVYGNANHGYFWEMELGYAFPVYGRKAIVDKPIAFFITHNTKQVFQELPLHHLEDSASV